MLPVKWGQDFGSEPNARQPCSRSWRCLDRSRGVVRVIEPARDRSPERRWEESSIERSGGLSFLRHSLKSAGPIPRQGPPGIHRSENKALPCTAATTEARKIVSVSMLGLNSIFAM